jgi:hypothetical protein
MDLLVILTRISMSSPPSPWTNTWARWLMAIAGIGQPVGEIQARKSEHCSLLMADQSMVAPIRGAEPPRAGELESYFPCGGGAGADAEH